MQGELQQAPAEQQADRQAADVAEKDLCHRPVERRESEHRAAQRGGNDRRRCRQFAEPAEQDHRGGDRHDLGHRHQVQPVHEVDEVHEPEAGDQQQGRARSRADRPERSADRRAPSRGRRRPPAPAAAAAAAPGSNVTSSAKPTPAMNSVAPKTASGNLHRRTRRHKAMTAPAAISVAAITAMPAPCGVGMRCDDRAFGLASATRSSSGRIAQ